MPSLTFLGAAGTVTGSKHLLDLGDHRILVDCGLFQGLKELRLRNWAPLPIDAAAHRRGRADARAPRSLRLSAAAGRAGLSRPGLLHAGHAGALHARAARLRAHSGRGRARRPTGTATASTSPALPLYTEVDAARALTQLQPVGYNRPVPVVPGVEVEFINAGHLLGSAYARCASAGKTILFGGDLGRYGRPVLPDPAPVRDARRAAGRIDLRRSAARARRRWRARSPAIVNDAVSARRQADHARRSPSAASKR